MVTAIQRNLDKETIKKILPHREKWLLLDEVLELNDSLASASKTFTEEECKGHFPFPLGLVVPGHLIAEALAQTGGVILASQKIENGQKIEDGQMPFLVETLLKFRKPVYPNQEVILKVEIERQKLGITFFKVQAYVDEKLAVKGRIGVAIKEK